MSSKGGAGYIEYVMSANATLETATPAPFVPVYRKKLRHVDNDPFHLWAHQVHAGKFEDYHTDREIVNAIERVQDYHDANYGHNSSKSRSFSGVRAYSYSTEMARIVWNVRGEKAYVLNNGSYSSMTGKAQSLIRRAIPLNERTFTLWNPNARWGDTFVSQCIDDPAYYVQVLIGMSADSTLKAKRARTLGDWHQGNAARWLQEAREWSAFWDLPLDVIPDDASGAAEALDVLRKAEAAAERQREKERLGEAKEAIAAWIAGTPGSHVPYGLPTAYMRLNPIDPEEVQTSQGAYVPTEHVRRLAPIILWALRNGRTYPFTALEGSTRLGHYTLDKITSTGDVIVGCHRFAREEIERFAAVLGIAPEGETV